ncbi:FimV/HubP family polar landmark protein, partial [Vibrio sp. WJH972]
TLNDEPDYISDDQLPEFGEDDALESAGFNANDLDLGESEDESAFTSESNQAEFLELEDGDLPEFNEDDANALFGDLPRTEFDESELERLLDDDADSGPFAKIDSPSDEMVASSGIDMDAMFDVSGEDWNGFTLSEEQKLAIDDDIDVEEKAVWQSEQNLDPEIENENWDEQDDIDSGVELEKYKTIGELMSHLEEGDESVPEELKLDVGLDEFPDVIGEIHDVDVDSNSEAAGKLDLAKIYLEMNDEKGAIQLLEKAIVDGDEDIRREAKHLIDSMKNR